MSLSIMLQGTSLDLVKEIIGTEYDLDYCGARSGKSQLAEQFAAQQGDNVLYIATSIITDDEMAERIAIHQQTRPAQWVTHEGYTELGDVILVIKPWDVMPSCWSALPP